MNGCTPKYGEANPCAGIDPSQIREQGLPGAVGLPGQTPTFVVGTVLTGPAPSVTFTMVNSLLYRVDFIIPSTNIHQAQTWTATQTFADVVVDGTFTSNGGATFDLLTVVTGITLTGISTFNGAATFNSSITAVAGITTNAITVSGLTTLNGAVKIPNITQLTAGQPQQGNVVVAPDGTLYFVVSSSSSNTAFNATALANVIAFGAAESALAANLNFTVPAGPDALVNLAAQLTFIFSGSNPPADISQFILRARLDNAVTGTVVAANDFSNFEASCNTLGQFSAAAGSHVLYFTVQGLGYGSSSVLLQGITSRVTF